MEQEKLNYFISVSSDFAKEYQVAKNDNTNHVSAIYFVTKLEDGVTLKDVLAFSDKRFKYNVEKPEHDNYNKLYANASLLSSKEAK